MWVEGDDDDQDDDDQDSVVTLRGPEFLRATAMQTHQMRRSRCQMKKFIACAEVWTHQWDPVTACIVWYWNCFRSELFVLHCVLSCTCAPSQLRTLVFTVWPPLLWVSVWFCVARLVAFRVSLAVPSCAAFPCLALLRCPAVASPHSRSPLCTLVVTGVRVAHIHQQL